ncbi:hypothetical protein BDF22DRAFT_29758 [Syncephalis plumigaleata]|nr:hypothetical protein BDF22DRAFT_29758 [Syncephalis plumigaleata]
MLESESRPMEQEVERECELQMQLREFEDTLNPDSDEITPGMNPWLNSSNNSNSNNNDVVENITSSSAPTYFRSKLNPEWDFFRGDPSPSPSSSCMSSPGLYPMPPGSATPFWSSGHPGANASSGGAGGPRRSSKRKASCDRMDPYTSALYKRRAGSPVMLPSSPRVLAGQHHHHQHHQYQQHGSTAWTAGLPSNVNAMISTSLPSPLSISASQSAPISGFSLGPPLQPLYSPSDIRSLSRRNSIINIQETNVTFGKMSLDDDDDNDDGHTDDNNSRQRHLLVLPTQVNVMHTINLFL